MSVRAFEEQAVLRRIAQNVRLYGGRIGAGAANSLAADEHHRIARLEGVAVVVLNSLDFMRGGQHGRMENCADVRASLEFRLQPVWAA